MLKFWETLSRNRSRQLLRRSQLASELGEDVKVAPPLRRQRTAMPVSMAKKTQAQHHAALNQDTVAGSDASSQVAFAQGAYHTTNKSDQVACTDTPQAVIFIVRVLFVIFTI